MTFVQATKDIFSSDRYWIKNGITAGFLFVIMCFFQIFSSSPSLYFPIFWTIFWFFIYMLTDAFIHRKNINRLLAAEKVLESLEKSKDNE